jgi:CP family cyanate transporter-like MFS transporter
VTAPAGAVTPRARRPARGAPERAGVGTVVAVVLLALNLRSVLAGLPPLVPDVRSELDISAAAAGVLTTLPVFCMGAFAPVAPWLAARWPMERTLALCALLTAVGTGMRGLGTTAAMFVAAPLIGVAIAIGQAVLPPLIRARYPRDVGLLTGALSMAIVLGSVLGAGAAVPLENAFGGWPGSLAALAVPALAAAVVWFAMARRAATTIARGRGEPLRRSGLAWAVSGYFGIQSMAFYASLSWIPSILEDAGWSSEAAGSLLALGALSGLLPAFFIPLAAERSRNQIALMTAIVLVPAAGLVGLLAAPEVAPAWMVLVGIGQSSSIALGFSLALRRGGDPSTAAALTSMALCVGYLVAATGPWLLGAVHDAVGDWTLPLIVLLAMTLAELLPGIPAARDRTIGR